MAAEQVARLDHAAFAREIPLDQDRLSRMVITGLHDIPTKLRELGVIEHSTKGPIVSTVMAILPEGGVSDAFIHVWSKKTTVKIPATVLFPGAPPEARLAFRNFDFQAFEFPPSSYFSKWVKSSDLDVQLMKSNNKQDGLYKKEEWADMGVMDFVLKVNVNPREDVGEANIHLVGIPRPFENLSTLPGDTASDGYPCVAMWNKVGMFAVPNLEPLRKDGLPVLPVPLSSSEVLPIPDSAQVLRAMYSFWSKPRRVVSANVASWTDLVKGRKGPNANPVLSTWAWPVFTEDLKKEGGELHVHAGDPRHSRHGALQGNEGSLHEERQQLRPGLLHQHSVLHVGPHGDQGTDSKGCSTTSSKKYVVLMGDVGTGKSTIVEKVSGVKGRSSSADESYTKSAEYFHSKDGELIICDTPGSNAMDDTFKQNVFIAEAMNLKPVSKIIITVRAFKRIDNVVKAVDEYAQRFIDLDTDLLGVIVTHMDEVGWAEDICKKRLREHLGMTDVIFTSQEETGRNLCRNILDVCNKEYNLHINSENFLKLFKINNKNARIVRSTKRQVDDFRALKESFFKERNHFKTSQKDMTDLIFEFQAWMTKRIGEAQKKVTEENGFSFTGGSTSNEASHIAHMTNQIATILRELRNIALGYQAEHNVSELRRCPFCNEVWAKFEGCDGDTTCGNRPRVLDLRERSYHVLGTFAFAWDGTKLEIRKGISKKIKEMEKGPGLGCGNVITWSAMPQVIVPSEFTATQPVNTDDIKLIPDEAQPIWEDAFRAMSDTVKDEMLKMRNTPSTTKST